jgi:flagellar hook-basal body complex protein FliE
MAPVPGIGAAGSGVSPFELLDSVKGTTKVEQGTDGGAKASDFAAVLKDKLTSLNSQQADAAKASEDMATGRVDDVAQTMLRIEQANVSLQMATQVRNKVIEAYQDILRMQM